MNLMKAVPAIPDGFFVSLFIIHLRIF